MTNTLLTLHDPAAAERYYAEGLWRKDTLYTLLCDHAARRPDDFALRDGARRLTWAALQAMVDAVAADLDDAGLKRRRTDRRHLRRGRRSAEPAPRLHAGGQPG